MTNKEFWESIRIDGKLEKVWNMKKDGMSYENICSMLSDDQAVLDAFNEVYFNCMYACNAPTKNDMKCVNNTVYQNELGTSYER